MDDYSKFDNEHLDRLVVTIANEFTAGGNFDDLVQTNCQLELRQLAYVTKSAVFIILRNLASNFGETRSVLNRLEDSNYIDSPQLQLNALIVLVEKGCIEDAIQLHSVLGINIEALKSCGRSSYADFALASGNDKLFMTIFECEINAVDAEKSSCMENVVSLIYKYARKKSVDASNALWVIVQQRLPLTLTSRPYANFIKKVRKDPSLEFSQSSRGNTLLMRRNDLIKAGNWQGLYDILLENIGVLLVTDEGNNMGLFVQDTLSLFNVGKHDLAFKLWLQIIERKPECAKAAYHFAINNRSRSIYRKNLLDILTSEPIRRRDKTAVSHLTPAIRSSEISIEGASKSLEDWFKAAATLASQANYNGAITMLFNLMDHNLACTPVVITKITNIVFHINASSVLSILDISTRVSKKPNLTSVFHAIASRLLQRGREDLANAIYEELHKHSTNPDVFRSRAHALLYLGRNEEAVNLMAEVIATYPQMVLVFVLYLLQKRLFNDCVSMYKKLHMQNRTFTLPFVYSVLRQENDDVFRSKALQLVLPDTKGLPMSSDEITVVSLIFDFLDWIPSKKLEYINDLERSRALPHDIAIKLQSKAHTAFIRQKIAERDKAIEEFVEARMPTLKTSNFFDEISTSLEIENPGRRTSKMARSVLTKPERMAPNNTMPGKKDRKN